MKSEDHSGRLKPLCGDECFKAWNKKIEEKLDTDNEEGTVTSIPSPLSSLSSSFTNLTSNPAPGGPTTPTSSSANTSSNGTPPTSLEMPPGKKGHLYFRFI